jgi:hypothetical protein
MSDKLANTPFQYQTNLFHGVLIEADNEVIRRVNAEVLIRSGCEVKRPQRTGVARLLKTPSRQQKLLGRHVTRDCR